MDFIFPAWHRVFFVSAAACVSATLQGAAPATGDGLFELGLPVGSGDYSYAHLVNADGSVVLGGSDLGAFQWRDGRVSRMRGSGAERFFPAAMTPDGRVIVGSARAGSGSDEHAFRLEGSVIQDLGTLGGAESYASAVSDDGATVVGAAALENETRHAFLWRDGVMTDIHVARAEASGAEDVSADGSVAVGTAAIRSGGLRAFRWENGESVVLPGLGGRFALGNAVSADGRVVGGSASMDRTGNEVRAVRWVDGKIENLGTLGGEFSFFQALSEDGAVVVGLSSLNRNRYHAFRWHNGRMADLGTLGGNYSEAAAVSASGAVVVGSAAIAGSRESRAFRWTESTGMLSVEEWLEAAGVEVSDTLHTEQAYGVSADGATVVGILTNSHAFIARAGKGLLTIEDMQESLQSGAGGLNMALSAGGLVLNGAHGHPLQRRTAPGRFTAWTAGDVGVDNHNERDGNLGVGEMGAGYNFGRAQANLAVGWTKGNQDTLFGGDADFDGVYVITDLIASVPGTPLVGTLTVFHQQGELQSRRGYLNAGLVDYSEGSTDVTTTGAAARLDWEDALTVRGFKITPYTKLSFSKTHVDGFTETGGGFPAVYDSRDDTISEVAIGVNTARALTKRITWVNTLEGVHRFQGESSTIDGVVAGVSAFSLPGEEYRQNWLRGTVGLDCAVGRGVFSISLNATTQGETASTWLASSYQIHF